MLVVGGCGPRGGPGMIRLNALGWALREAGLDVSVLTDGLTEGRIRTGIGARELGRREPTEFSVRAETAYAARYAGTALPALEGAGFG